MLVIAIEQQYLAVFSPVRDCIKFKSLFEIAHRCRITLIIKPQHQGFTQQLKSFCSVSYGIEDCLIAAPDANQFGTDADSNFAGGKRADL